MKRTIIIGLALLLLAVIYVWIQLFNPCDSFGGVAITDVPSRCIVEFVK